MWLAFLALTAAGAGRHRVAPNQQVWEQIRSNMERKKAAALPTAPVAEQKPAPTIVQDVDAEDPFAKVLKSPRRAAMHGRGAKFLQYNGRRPVGRRALHHRPMHHKRMSAVAHTAGTRSAQGISRAISKQIAEMKAREREIAAQEAEAKTEAITNMNGMNVQDRKSLVDKVFRPPAAGKATGPKVEQGFEDPFADLHTPSFAAEQRQELKSEKPLLKSRAKKVIADLPSQAVDEELAAKEQTVMAEAGADTPSSKDFVFDVNKDTYDGVQAMEKDAERMAAKVDTAAIGEVKARQAAEAKRSELAKKKQELVNGPEQDHVTSTSTPETSTKADAPKVKEATLSDAIQGANEAEERQELDHTAEALGKLWAKKTHDKSLNSELATETRVNFKVEQAKIAKVIDLEDKQEADQLEDIDREWEKRFPETSGKTAAARKRGSSGWGVLSSDLASKGIQSA